MTRYSDSGKYGSRRNYKPSMADLYRMLYRSPYRNPYRIKSLGRYQQPRSREGYRPSTRSYSRLHHFPRQSPEPKYKPIPKERISSPIRREPLRYTERHTIRTEPHAEQMIKDAEGRLNQQLMEKLEAEINKLRSEVDSVEASKANSSIEPREAIEQNESSKQTKTIEVEEEPEENSEIRQEVETEVEVKEEPTEPEESEPAEKTEENVETMDSENEELLRDMHLEDEAEVLRDMEATEELEDTTETEPIPDNEASGEMVEESAPEMTGQEVKMERVEDADHLEAYIIDEGWIDEDGLNPLFPYVEPEPERVDVESENVEQTEAEC